MNHRYITLYIYSCSLNIQLNYVHNIAELCTYNIAIVIRIAYIYTVSTIKASGIVICMHTSVTISLRYHICLHLCMCMHGIIYMTGIAVYIIYLYIILNFSHHIFSILYSRQGFYGTPRVHDT